MKYHKGARGTFVASAGEELPITLASNPSHLEAVDPVVEGMTRAKQDRLSPPTDGTPAAAAEGVAGFPCMSVLVHGDAAFAGQGVVAETLNLSGLSGYRTGGTVHLVINNQLGFTTAPASARTSVYPTDVAKMVQAPIFHVNGDDPEACVRAARLAFMFRQTFHKDVVIDLVCYRKHGHNEGDDPSYTQPLMYQRIEAKRSVRKLYTETLVRRGDITLDEAESALDDFNAKLQAVLDEVRGEPSLAPTELPAPEPILKDVASPQTGVAPDVLRALSSVVRSVPDGFTIHPKLERQFAQREELVAAGQVDWALAEALAIGSLMYEDVNVRLTGQDTRRGTFSQRHDVLVDYNTGAEYVPLAHIRDGLQRIGATQLTPSGEMGNFTVRDSLLSEYAALGFEYGYSVEAPEALVAWEAQFGDFANGAQIIIDNFVVAAENKWGQYASLVLLLPHGYEGQGPEHSSSRFERFLSLSARGNIRVTVPTTAAQYFHLLRSQARLEPKRPLVVVTPKSMLRAHATRSTFAELESGSFQHVIDDPSVEDPSTGAPYRAVQREDQPGGGPAPDGAGARPGEPGRRREGRTDLSVAGPVVDGDLRALRRGDGGCVAAGGAREHGRLVLRARQAPRLPPGAPATSSREPGRVPQPRHRECRPPPAGAGRSIAACHWLNRITSWWTGRTSPPKEEPHQASSSWTRPFVRTPPRTRRPRSSWWWTPPSNTGCPMPSARRCVTPCSMARSSRRQPARSVAATPSYCGLPSAPGRPCFPTTPFRSSTESIRGSSTTDA